MVCCTIFLIHIKWFRIVFDFRHVEVCVIHSYNSDSSHEYLLGTRPFQAMETVPRNEDPNKAREVTR